MDDKTREALEGSIKKWEAIVARTGKDRGAYNCPLCELFYNCESPHEEGVLPEHDMCWGCPVSTRTGQRACGHTPYPEWSDEAARVYDSDFRTLRMGGWSATTDKLLDLAKQELEFLKSLRDEK
jgi:hypothetical protein